MIAGGVSPSIATAIAYVAANFGPLPKRALALGLFFSVRLPAVDRADPLQVGNSVRSAHSLTR